jgi:hypothetical protein
MMSRRHRFLAAFCALAAMLFAQAAFALAACDPGGASSRAQMVTAHELQDSGCHEPAENTNLCLAHCQSGEQTLDKHQVKVPDAPLQRTALARAWPDALQPAREVLRAPLPAAGAPPRILFRSLLI